MLFFEDYLLPKIDELDMNDNDRKQYVQDNLDQDFIFIQLRRDIQALGPEENIIIPHVTTTKQALFLYQLGGIVVNAQDKHSLTLLADSIKAPIGSDTMGKLLECAA